MVRKVAKKKGLEGLKKPQENMVSPKPRVENFKEEVVSSNTFSRKIHLNKDKCNQWISQQKVTDCS